MADIGWITGHTCVSLLTSHLIGNLILGILISVTSSTALSPTVSPPQSSNPPPFTPHLLVTGKPLRSTSSPNSTPHPLPSVSSVVSASTTSRTTISPHCVSLVPSVNPSTLRHGTGTTTTLVAGNALSSIPSGRRRRVPSSSLRSPVPSRRSLVRRRFRSSVSSQPFSTPSLARSSRAMASRVFSYSRPHGHQLPVPSTRITTGTSRRT